MEAIAIRRFRLSGRLFQAGDTVIMPPDQFSDLSLAGLVERKPVSKTKTRRAAKTA